MGDGHLQRERERQTDGERDVSGLARTERVCIGLHLGVSVTEDRTRRILVGIGYLPALSYKAITLKHQLILCGASP